MEDLLGWGHSGKGGTILIQVSRIIFEFLHALRSILVHLGYNNNTLQPYFKALVQAPGLGRAMGAVLTTNHTLISIREQFRVQRQSIIISDSA